MLHAAMLRSPHAHARIVAIDAREAAGDARRLRGPDRRRGGRALRPHPSAHPHHRGGARLLPGGRSRALRRASRWPRWPRSIARPRRTRSSGSASSTSRCRRWWIPRPPSRPARRSSTHELGTNVRLARHAHLRPRRRGDGARGRRAARALHDPALRLDPARDLRLHRGVRRGHRRLRVLDQRPAAGPHHLGRWPPRSACRRRGSGSPAPTSAAASATSAAPPTC